MGTLLFDPPDFCWKPEKRKQVGLGEMLEYCWDLWLNNMRIHGLTGKGHKYGWCMMSRGMYGCADGALMDYSQEKRDGTPMSLRLLKGTVLCFCFLIDPEQGTVRYWYCFYACVHETCMDRIIYMYNSQHPINSWSL